MGELLRADCGWEMSCGSRNRAEVPPIKRPGEALVPPNRLLTTSETGVRIVWLVVSLNPHPEENNSDLIEMAEMEFQPWSDTTPEAMVVSANRTHMVWLRIPWRRCFKRSNSLSTVSAKEMNDEMIDEMFNGFQDAKGFLKVATETIRISRGPDNVRSFELSLGRCLC